MTDRVGTPRFMLRIFTADGVTTEFPYQTALGARNDLDIVMEGQPRGFWSGDRFYPIYQILYADIVEIAILEADDAIRSEEERTEVDSDQEDEERGDRGAPDA